MARAGARDAASLRRELATGKTAPVYLLFGEEAFLKEEAAAGTRAGNGRATGGTIPFRALT